MFFVLKIQRQTYCKIVKNNKGSGNFLKLSATKAKCPESYGAFAIY